MTDAPDGGRANAASRGTLALHFALIAAIGVAAYWPVFFNDFTYDAHLVAGDNAAIRDIGNLRALVTGDYFVAFGENTYRPLVTLTYFLDFAIFGNRSGGFGATSLAWHVLAVCGFLVVARRRVGTVPALAAALVYVVHAAPSEAVYCAGHREALMGGAFVWWAIACHDRAGDGSRPWRAASLALYALGLFAIESVILVPAYLAVEAFVLGKSDRDATARRLWPFALIALAFLAGRTFVFAGTRGPTPFYGGSRGAALVAGFAFFAKYLALAAYPRALGLTSDYAGVTMTDLGTWAFAGGIAFAALVATVCVRRVPTAMRTGLAWFAISLLPVLHFLVPFWIPMAERYTYVGVGAMALAIFAPMVTSIRAKGVSRFALAVMISGALLNLGLETHERGADWRNDAALWQSAAKAQPRSAVAWSNYADALSKRGDQSGREDALRRLIEIDPQNAGAMETLITIALRHRRVSDAGVWLARLDAIGAPILMRERARAQIAIAAGDMTKAEAAATACLAEDERDGICLQALGFALFSRGENAVAASRFAECAKSARDEAVREACAKGEIAAKTRTESPPDSKNIERAASIKNP